MTKTKKSKLDKFKQRIEDGDLTKKERDILNPNLSQKKNTGGYDSSLGYKESILSEESSYKPETLSSDKSHLKDWNINIVLLAKELQKEEEKI